MIRAVALAVVAVLFGLVLAATMAGYHLYGAVAVLGVLLVGLLFERARYGALRTRPGGDAWQPTDERFIDDASGKATRVWFNPATGERRYVDDAG